MIHETPIALGEAVPTAEEDRRERGLWAWSFLDALLMIVLVIVLAVPLFGYFLYADGVFNLAFGTAAFQSGLETTLATVQKQPDRFFATFVVQDLAFLIPPLFRVVVLRRLPLGWFGITLQRLWPNVRFGLILGIVALGSNIALSKLFERLGQHPNQSEALFSSMRAGAYGSQALLFLMAAVIAPIVEEFVFRGYIFKAWYLRWGAPVAYFVSAMVFALPHAIEVTQGQIGLIVPIFVIGLLLAWGFHRSRSLVPGIVAHVVNNGVSTALLIVCTNSLQARCT
ncbi:MAG: hypothetical protein NVSMB42_10240 [Herpetosiphon sp.]